jgi:hypothetical protein
MSLTRTKWWMPLFSLFLGVLCFGAFAIGGDVGAGVWALGVMGVLAVAMLLGGRSEMVRGLRGDGRDEYWERMDVHASYLAGMTLLALVLGMCLWEWGNGRSGTPYAQLAAISGVAYLLALGLLRWRS